MPARMPLPRRLTRQTTQPIFRRRKRRTPSIFRSSNTDRASRIWRRGCKAEPERSVSWTTCLALPPKAPQLVFQRMVLRSHLRTAVSHSARRQVNQLPQPSAVVHSTPADGQYRAWQGLAQTLDSPTQVSREHLNPFQDSQRRTRASILQRVFKLAPAVALARCSKAGIRNFKRQRPRRQPRRPAINSHSSRVRMRYKTRPRRAAVYSLATPPKRWINIRRDSRARTISKPTTTH